MKKKIQQLIKILFSILWIWTLLSIIVNVNLDYASKQPTNIIFCLLLSLVLIIGFHFIKDIQLELDKKKKILLFIIILIIQVFLFNSILFKTGWDSSTIFDDAILLRSNASDSILFDYYSIHPNNVFICTLYYWLFSILKIFNIRDGRSLLLISTVINSILSNLSCFMVYSLLNKRTNKKYALFGYILSLLLLAFSPWNLIPYSDQLALIIPISIYYVYDKKCNLTIKLLLITLLSFIGYHLKPQSIIILIAIIIVNVFYISKEKVKIITRPLGLSLIVLLLFVVSFNQYTKSLGFIRDKDKQFDVTHYIKMGLNKETYGAFNDNDVNVSEFCESKEERIRYNSKIIKERLSDFGLTGYFDFLSKKICITFSDGTFSWGKEGDFYREEFPNNSNISILLKDILYNEGKYFIIYSSIQTICWFIILVSITFRLFNKFIFKEECILELTIIGIILFQLLFETRARYLLVNVPLLIVVSMIGLYSSKLYNNVNETNK